MSIESAPTTGETDERPSSPNPGTPMSQTQQIDPDLQDLKNRLAPIIADGRWIPPFHAHPDRAEVIFGHWGEDSSHYEIEVPEQLRPYFLRLLNMLPKLIAAADACLAAPGLEQGTPHQPIVGDPTVRLITTKTPLRELCCEVHADDVGYCGEIFLDGETGRCGQGKGRWTERNEDHRYLKHLTAIEAMVSSVRAKREADKGEQGKPLTTHERAIEPQPVEPAAGEGDIRDLAFEDFKNWRTWINTKVDPDGDFVGATLNDITIEAALYSAMCDLAGKHAPWSASRPTSATAGQGQGVTK